MRKVHGVEILTKEKHKKKRQNCRIEREVVLNLFLFIPIFLVSNNAFLFPRKNFHTQKVEVLFP